MDPKDKPAADLREKLRFFEEIGAGFAFKRKPRTLPAAAGIQGPAAPAAASDAENPPGKWELPGAVRSLDAIAAEIRTCRKCRLAGGRTLAVPGEGNPKSPLLFVGEGPGHDEDVQGRPFVGRAGQLLTKIIAAMGFERSEVFIANIVKCRPPDNRVPQRDEAEACIPFLLEQIAAIRPRVIVALGKTSADFFIPNIKAMSSVRGIFHEWRGISIMPTFHPSYLVRNEGNKEIKKVVWGDMQKVMALLAGG